MNTSLSTKILKHWPHRRVLYAVLWSMCGVWVCWGVGCASSTGNTSIHSTQPPVSTAKRNGQKIMMSLYSGKQRLLKKMLVKPVKNGVRVSKLLKKKEKVSKQYTLAELLHQAYKQSPMMREAQYQLLSLKARQSEAFWANWWPQGTLVALVAPGPPARGDAMNTTTPQPEAFVNLAEYGVLTRVDFNLVWPLFTFGKLSLLHDAAKAGVKLGESNVALAKSKWTLLVKEMYYGLQLAESSLELLEEAEEAVKDAKKKVKGKVDKLKIVLIDTEVRARRVQAEMGRRMALSTLSRMTGLPSKPGLELKDYTLQEPTFPVKSMGTYMKLAKQHRPELKLLDHAIQARLALMKMQQRMWAPDLFIGAFFRHGFSSAADDQVSPFARDDFNFLETGVFLGLRFSLDVPLKLARARRAEADYLAFKSRRNLAVNAIQLQIEQRFRELKAARQLVSIQKVGKKAANKWLTRTMISFGSGLVNVKEVSDALLASAKTRFSYLQAMYQSWLSAARLSRAVGVDVTRLPVDKKKK